MLGVLHVQSMIASCFCEFHYVMYLIVLITCIIIIWKLDEWEELASHQRSLIYHSRFCKSRCLVQLTELRPCTCDQLKFTAALYFTSLFVSCIIFMYLYYYYRTLDEWEELSSHQRSLIYMYHLQQLHCLCHCPTRTPQ